MQAKNIFQYFCVALLLISSASGIVLLAQDTQTPRDQFKITLIASLTVMEEITNFIPTNTHDSRQLGLILTNGSVYELENNFSNKLLIEGVNKKSRNSTDLIVDASRSGTVAVEYVFESEIAILNLKTKQQLKLKARGEPAISENTILLADAEGLTSEIIDFAGKRIKYFVGQDSVMMAKAHNSGFAGSGSVFQFFNAVGMVTNKIPGIWNGNFDTSYSTGTTVTLAPDGALEKSMPLTIYDKNGQVVQRLTLPFAGYQNGLGISENGKFIAASCQSENLVVFLDVESGKLLWSKNFKLGQMFTTYKAPIPISSGGEYIIIDGSLEMNNGGKSLFIVLNAKGDVVGYIDPKPASVMSSL